MPTADPSPSDAAPDRELDRLSEQVYAELRRLSQQRIAAEPGVVTVSATGLVHEAYLRLVGQEGFTDRGHFLAVASRAMRRVLIDRARARSAAKRGGAGRPVTLDPDAVRAEDDLLDEVLSIDAALDRLAAVDERLAQVVELRFFGGLTVQEVAEVLGVTPRTAARDWARAKAHLHRFLTDPS